MANSVPYIFNTGDIAKAQEVNDDFAAIMTDLDTKADKDFLNINSEAIQVIKNNSVYPRNIGEIIWSTVPQVDAALHLADGSLINGDGIFSTFVEKISEKYESLRPYAIVTYNVNITGSIVNTNGVLSNFGNGNYAKLPSVFNPGANDWKLTIYAKTPASYDTEEFIIGSGVTTVANYQGLAIGVDSTGHTTLYLSTNGTSWNIANGLAGSSFLANSTYYYFKLERSGNNYTLSISTDGETWEVQTTLISSSSVFASSQPLCLGGNFGYVSNTQFWRGDIDLNKTNIVMGSNYWWKGTLEEVPGFCSEEAWQQSRSTYGVAGKFVYNPLANTVRLPLITGFIEGTSDMNKLGEITSAGLPNIVANFTSWGPSGAAILTSIGTTEGLEGGGLWGGVPKGNVQINASWASSIYGNSVTVQPQSLKYYVYIVVGESVKTNIQVDIDNVVNDLNRLSASYVVSSYTNGPSGYVKYSNGYCEQWGSVSVGSGGNVTVNMLIPFIDMNYNLLATSNGSYYGAGEANNTAVKVSLSQINISNGSHITSPFSWKASGYVAY